MLDVVTRTEAEKIIEENFGRYTLPAETAELSAAAGRVLMQDIVSREDLPAFNRSTVDGYALIAADTFGCSESIPAMLSFAGAVEMGKHFCGEIKSGQCVYVPTGGEVPEPCDAVVMIEYAQNYNDGLRYIEKAAAPGENIIFKCDEAVIGQTIVKEGTLITSKITGTLAALGYDRVKVRHRPVVGVISTGDELVKITEVPAPGQIRDVNSFSLSAAIEECGALSRSYGIIKDDFKALETAVAAACDECDIVIVSGGSSVGEKDFTAEILQKKAGSPLLFHGVSLKPGKPTICADASGKALFGLPGHPLAAFFICEILIKPLILKLSGIQKNPVVRDAVLSSAIPSNHGREEIVPVKLNGGIAEPIFTKSSLITVLAKADGYIFVPRDKEGMSAGDKTEVYLFAEEK